MNEDALFAIGTLLAALGGLLERKGVCTTLEWAETLGDVAIMTGGAGDEYHGRAAYIGGWAQMVRAAALNDERSRPH